MRQENKNWSWGVHTPFTMSNRQVLLRFRKKEKKEERI